MASDAAEGGVPFDPSSLELADISSEVEILHIAGPESLAFMKAVCPDVASVGFLKMKPLDVCGAPARVFCISFTGELGYELHVPIEHAARLYEAIWDHPAAEQHGLQPFGGHAVNSLRVEKGFKVKADLDYAHWTEAGIEPFVKLKRKAVHHFVGRDSPAPRTRHAAIFEVDAPAEYAWSVPGASSPSPHHSPRSAPPSPCCAVRAPALLHVSRLQSGEHTTCHTHYHVRRPGLLARCLALPQGTLLSAMPTTRLLASLPRRPLAL